METQEINGETIVSEVSVETPADNSGSSDNSVLEGQTGSEASDGSDLTGQPPENVQEGQEEPVDGVQDGQEVSETPIAEETPEEVPEGQEEAENETEEGIEESGEALESAEQGEGGSDEGPLVEYSLENPMPVTIVEPLPEEQELEVFSLSGSYPGTISETYLTYFRGIVQKLDWDEHYVVYRSGQYSYSMVYGEDVGLNGDRFTGTGDVVTIYRNSSSYSSDWYVDYSRDTLALDSSDLFVYSDLGMYPTLKEGGSAVEFSALLFAAGFAVVYSVCHDIFDYIMEHVYRK